jgi:hypothetical protein
MEAQFPFFSDAVDVAGIPFFPDTALGRPLDEPCQMLSYHSIPSTCKGKTMVQFEVLSDPQPFPFVSEAAS